MRECDQKFLCFSWRSRFYSFTSLPFGLSSAPRVFTKLCRPIAAHFRSRGIRLLVYLDDWLLMAQSKDQAVEDFENVSFFLEKLGFLINHAKSCGAPVQVTEHLGLIINSNSMSFALPEDKLEKILALIRKILIKDLVKLRTLSSLLGNLVWAIPAFPFTQAHYRTIQQFLIIQNSLVNNLNHKVRIPDSVQEELRWWLANLRDNNGKCFIVSDPDLVIYADASNSGWGAFCNGVGTGGPWSSLESLLHINCKELIAAWYALRSFVKDSGLSAELEKSLSNGHVT